METMKLRTARRDIIRLLPASLAPASTADVPRREGRSRWPGFLTRGATRAHSLPGFALNPVTVRGSHRTADFANALPAYSGGTVWGLHPLRVAAGASVSCGGNYTGTRDMLVGLPHAAIYA